MKQINKMILFVLIAVLLASFVTGASGERTYVFRVIKDGLRIIPAGIELYDSPFSEYSNKNIGDYSAVLFDESKRLYSVNFSFDSFILLYPSRECLDEQGNFVCDVSKSEEHYSDVIVNFPYFSNADNVRIIHGNDLILTYKFKNPFLFEDYWYYFVIGVSIFLAGLIFWFYSRRST